MNYTTKRKGWCIVSRIFNVTASVDREVFYNYRPDPYIPRIRGKLVVDDDDVIWGYCEETESDKFLRGIDTTSILFGAVADYAQNRYGACFFKRTSYRGCGIFILPEIENPNNGMWFSWGCYVSSVDVKIVFEEQPFSADEEKLIKERFRKRLQDDEELIRQSIKFIDHEYVNKSKAAIKACRGQTTGCIFGEELRNPRSEEDVLKRAEEKKAGKRDLLDLGVTNE